MATSDALKVGLQQRFNLSAPIWSTPTNLIPIVGGVASDLTVNFDGEATFPAYENGDSFHWQAGIELQAVSRVRGADAALQQFATNLQFFNATRLWGQRYSWLQGSPEGFDVITDGLYTLYGGLLASLNVRVDLLEGVVVLGPAAAQLEGVTLTLGLGGRDVPITVQDGWARVGTPAPAAAGGD